MPLIDSSPLGRIHWIADLDVAGSASALVAAAGPLLEAGLPSLQIRGRGRTTEELVDAGRELRRITAAAGALFLVNADPEAAARLEADGVHLTAFGPTVEAARQLLPAGSLVGASAHDAAEVDRASAADWIFVSLLVSQAE